MYTEIHYILTTQVLYMSSSFVKFTSQLGDYKTKRFGSCATTIFSGGVLYILKLLQQK